MSENKRLLFNTMYISFSTFTGFNIPYIPLYTTEEDSCQPIEICVRGVQHSGAVKPSGFSRTMGVKNNVSNFCPIFVETHANLKNIR